MGDVIDLPVPLNVMVRTVFLRKFLLSTTAWTDIALLGVLNSTNTDDEDDILSSDEYEKWSQYDPFDDIMGAEAVNDNVEPPDGFAS